MTDDEAEGFFARIEYLEKENESLRQQLALVQKRMDWEADRAAKLDVALDDTRQQLAECQAELTRELQRRFDGNAESSKELAECEKTIKRLDKENLELHLAATYSESELRKERKKLESCLANKWKSRCEKAEQQLAECKAENNKLRGALRQSCEEHRSESMYECGMYCAESESAIRAAKREALLAAADFADGWWVDTFTEYQSYKKDIGDELRSRAKELE